MFNATPWIGGDNANTNLLSEFAFQSVKYCLTGFDFTAREFPITGIRFTFGTRAEEHIAVRLHQNAHCNIDGWRSVTHGK
jgi:hypothetical protein